MIAQLYQFTGTINDIAHINGFRNYNDYMAIVFEKHQLAIVFYKDPSKIVTLNIISDKKDNNIISPEVLNCFYNLISSGLIVYNSSLELPDLPTENTENAGKSK